MTGPPEDAAAAGLRYVTDEEAGISRIRWGKGFRYRLPGGTWLAETRERERMAALVIPPAWEDVWISSDPRGHILATGRDARGRKQYLYHPEWRAFRDDDKFSRMAAFGKGMPTLRQTVDQDLRRHSMPRRKVVALVVALLDETLIRVGNDSYALDNESFGLTTLTDRHVELGITRLVFDFTGKGGAEHRVPVRDRRLVRLVAACQELGGQRLFTYLEEGKPGDLRSEDVNAYLAEITGAELTAKDFRTWGASRIVTQALARAGPAPDDERAAARLVLGALDEAADQLGNTRAIVRDSYVHPVVGEAFVDGRLDRVWRATRGRGQLDRPERALLRLLES